MKATRKFCLFMLLVSMIVMLVLACDSKKAGKSPVSPADVSGVMNYAQDQECSTTITVNGEQHQLNFAVNDVNAHPYGSWLYAEINEQRGRGHAPGINQVPVNLRNITFTFSGLPEEVTEIIAGIKNKESADESYLKIGGYTAQQGTVIISMATEHLIAYFGPTHYSVWFQVIGGKNGQGITGEAQLTLEGTLPGGQRVTLSKAIRFGTHPQAQIPSGPTSPSTKVCEVITPVDDLSTAGSLRNLLADTTCNTITFDNTLSTITVSNQLEVNRPVIIDGSGSAITISGGGSTRVFWLTSSANVTLKNLTVSGGKVSGPDTDPQSFGGGIHNDGGIVTIKSGTTIRGNSATGGGGIFTVNGTTIVKGTIRENSGTAAGGIFNFNGTLMVSGNVKKNTSTASGGFAAGIYNKGSGAVLIVKSGGIIGGTSFGDGNNGDGIFNEHGKTTIESGANVSYNTSVGIYNNEGEVIINGTIHHNSLSGVGATKGKIVNNGTISNNTGERGAGIASDGQVENYGNIVNNTATLMGGGIHMVGDGVMNNYGTISGNTSQQRGGGVFCFVGATCNNKSSGQIVNNRADEDGGGIYNNGGFADSIVNNEGTISNNKADSDGNGSGAGGGVFNSKSNAILNNTGTISGNTATTCPQIRNSDGSCSP